MEGRLVTLELDSRALRGNPLGDPACRELRVYVPPGDAGGLPLVVFLHGFTGSGRGWLSAAPFGPSVPERIDALITTGAVPPLVAAFPDGQTALGGTQWIDAPAVGRYQSYVAEDVVQQVEREIGTAPDRQLRAVVGKSSGGYGALCMARDRAATFAHVACHAGDACFEYAYLGDFPKAAAALLAAGGDVMNWLAGMKQRARATKLGSDDLHVVNVLAMAANYADDPDAPLQRLLPFDPQSGRLREEVWARWLAHDPARFVPRSLDAFRSLATLYVDCGTRDEFNLRWGARMVVDALRAGGVAVVHEEFEDGHMGIEYRYETSLRLLGARLRR